MVRNWSPARVAHVLYVTGYIATVTSISALVLGLLVVQVGASDLRATLEVSGEAMEAIVDTVDVIEDVTSEIRDSIDAAADGVNGVSATATIGAGSIEEVAVFLEEDLPADLDAIRRAMPAAVQAAGAIDGTLRALRFVGVSYSPEEPFDDSLRSVEAALADMPDDLRSQSESLRNLVPAATRLAGEADRLALALTRLGDDLATLEGITQTYDQTLTEASATIDLTGSKLDRNLWLLRIALAAMAIAGVALGVGLIAMSRFVDLNLSTARVEVTKALAAGSEDR
jgi:enamine deaminase RidA (YjgF/YER057c/UK114 family)